MKKLLFTLSLIQLLFFNSSHAQKPKRYNSSEIQLRLEKLNVLGNVLYVAAHPDDENTRLITYMANEKKLNTAYFSFTRGDGGQNLVGSEISEQLGVIRTQELLEARKIDNGHQYFSRAVDFGYSKHPDETFSIWDKEKVLGDLVWIIRKFRPDIIITRFNTIPGTTHGHHTASAILANEAFDIAGDNTKYPEQLIYVDPWQPESLYWNAYFWRRSDYQKDTADLIAYDIGKFNTLLGQSYSEIAALSRSSHRSQGFGATGTRGIQMDYLQHEKGYKAKDDAFEQIDLSWKRVEGGEPIGQQIDKMLKAFNPNKPTEILNGLLGIRKSISVLDDEFWKNKKLNEVDILIYAITGLYMEVKAKDYTASPGEEVEVEIEAINRSKENIRLIKVVFNPLGIGSNYNIDLNNNQRQQLETKITLPASALYSQPYWLENKHNLGMFHVDDQRLIGDGENAPAISAVFKLEINGEEIEFLRPLIYKKNDPVRGEVYRPFVITPPIYANIKGDVMIFANHASQQIEVVVEAGTDQAVGKVSLNLPSTWKVNPGSYDFTLDQKGESKSYFFNITPPENQEIANAEAIIEMGGKRYDKSLIEIEYDHIPDQLLFNKSSIKCVKIDLEKGKEKIGYIMGAGDIIPDNLRQIGYDVDVINDQQFDDEILDEFDVIILGVRALNTENRLKFDIEKLLQYVHRGGNLIMQYNTSHRLVVEEFSPYPMTLSRNRVAIEGAEVQVLNENHPVLNYPNKINDHDFDNWIQERGLYFPGTWSDDYEVVISSHDPGEDALDGGILVSKYGKGIFIYSSYSWFRELPAGVPGAYRLFVNMISLNQERY